MVSGYIFEEPYGNADSLRRCFTVLLTERANYAIGWIQIPFSQSLLSNIRRPLRGDRSIECAVCYEGKPIPGMVMLECNHIMCQMCLGKLNVSLETGKKPCPFCRKDVIYDVPTTVRKPEEIKIPIYTGKLTNGKSTIDAIVESMFPKERKKHRRIDGAVLFSRRYRRFLMRTEPFITHGERTSRTAEAWHALSEDQRQLYENHKRVDVWPVSGFLIFAREYREAMKKHTDSAVTFAEKSKKVANAWNALSPSEQLVYQNRAADQLRAFEREIAEIGFPTLSPKMNTITVGLGGNKSGGDKSGRVSLSPSIKKRDARIIPGDVVSRIDVIHNTHEAGRNKVAEPVSRNRNGFDLDPCELQNVDDRNASSKVLFVSFYKNCALVEPDG